MAVVDWVIVKGRHIVIWESFQRQALEHSMLIIWESKKILAYQSIY